MNNIEYYKSLISDEEVIKALVKESKAREGELCKGKTRIRPNINFFQRTVTNLVSSNKRRVTTKQEEVAPRNQSKRDKIKAPHTLMKEILLSNKVNLVDSKEKGDITVKKAQLTNKCRPDRIEQSGVELNRKVNKAVNQRKISGKRHMINFNLNLNKSKFVETASTNLEIVSPCEKRMRSNSSDSSSSVISISSSKSNCSVPLSDVIKISDSDSDQGKRKFHNKSQIKGGRDFKHKKKKPKKKRKRRKSDD